MSAPRCLNCQAALESWEPDICDDCWRDADIGDEYDTDHALQCDCDACLHGEDA